MEKIRFGVLGCANIARKYGIAAIKKVGELIAVASRSKEKAEEWAKEFQCEAETYESLLNREDIDAIYMPLPVGLHKEWVIKAAKAGKHILCEKALASSYHEAIEMVSACRENNVFLFENYMVNYHPQHEKVISLIKSGEIGDLKLFSSFCCYPPFKDNDIRYDEELGGGALNDPGGYITFLARKFFADEPESVFCSLFNGNKKVDIQGSLNLEFKNGKTATGFFGFDHFYQSNYFVLGTKGKISVGRGYALPGDLKPDVTLQKQDIQEKIDIEPANQFDLSFQEFVNKISQERDYSSLLNQAKVMECLRISAKEGRKVYLRELSD